MLVWEVFLIMGSHNADRAPDGRPYVPAAANARRTIRRFSDPDVRFFFTGFGGRSHSIHNFGLFEWIIFIPGYHSWSEGWTANFRASPSGDIATRRGRFPSQSWVGFKRLDLSQEINISFSLAFESNTVISAQPARSGYITSIMSRFSSVENHICAHIDIFNRIQNHQRMWSAIFWWINENRRESSIVIWIANIRTLHWAELFAIE
jgi:hypothetical protein